MPMQAASFDAPPSGVFIIDKERAIWHRFITEGDSHFKERLLASRTKRESKGSPKAVPPEGPKGPQGARGARTRARRACEGERSETVVPETTD